MTFIARSRTDSEVSSSTNQSYGPWASDLFQRYQLPTASSCCDGCHRVEIHYLGVANLQYGTLVSTAAFYEVTENDVPEPSKSISSSTTHLDTMMMDMDHGDEQAIEHHHPDTITKRASPVLFSSSLSSPMAPPPIAPETSLPPKKRRRHKVLRHDVVFCLDPPSSLHHHEPSTDLEYYLFPHDAITEAMNDHPPFEVLCSFHADVDEQKSNRPYATKLEEFAAVCSSAARRRSSTVETEDTRSRVVNMRLSGVSRRLFLAIKQTVSEFENVCEKMVQLMKFHTQQTNGVRTLSSTMATTTTATITSPPPKQEQAQTEWEEMLCATPKTTFQQRDDKGVTEENDRATTSSTPSQQQPNKHARSASTGSAVKKCLYCGSKSTPMWRRGPQGAGTLCNACGVKWKHGKILAGSSSSNSSNDTGPTTTATLSTPSTSTRERRGSDKKRKKSMGSTRRTKAAAAAATAAAATSRMSDDDMENNITAAQNLSISDSSFAVPWPVHQPHQPTQMPYEAHSLSSSMSGSYSPLDESSPGSSPPLSVIVQHRRHTVDMASLSDTPFAGVDAVEAAAVLTLLKRS
ncbi:predicted protein [Lichtheimia corymbifera JMRC:FSU:9682]|uniref:GATA-type domain-containing protein n=1 Tax=Lichtheimia corymbifera JMRC:FSU:9682 TaxID=1263082 RepID=A0A068S2Y8_9FUNG|nr:predicted protein [Lichtheimia corymbifera JMRC:FSU:9682]